MKKLGIGIVFVVLALVAFVALFLLASYVLMLLVNVLLGQYEAQLLTYQSSMAITAILVLFGGMLRGGSSK